MHKFEETAMSIKISKTSQSHESKSNKNLAKSYEYHVHKCSSSTYMYMYIYIRAWIMIYILYLAIWAQHDVVWVSISNTQHVSSNTASSTRISEVLNSLIHGNWIRILYLEPLIENPFVKSTLCTLGLLLDLGNSTRVQDYFNHSHLVPSGQTQVWVHPANKHECADCQPLPTWLGNHIKTWKNVLQIKAWLLPQLVHQSHYLQSQHILTKVYKMN